MRLGAEVKGGCRSSQRESTLPDTESRSMGALEGRVGKLQAVHSEQMGDGRGYMPKVTNSYFK